MKNSAHIQTETTEPFVLIGLDVGESRTGVARAHSLAKLPEPLTVVSMKADSAVQQIHELIKQQQAELLVVGLPLQENNAATEQSIKVREFIDKLQSVNRIAYVYVNENHTSNEAQMYMQERGVKSDQEDAIAACIILERYFAQGSADA